MYNIRAHSVGSAHEQAIYKVMKDGVSVTTQDNEKTFELPEPLNIFIATPMATPRISPCSMFKEKAMEEYVHDLLIGKEGTFAYTYHDRLFGYPFAKPGSDDIFYLDQINEVIVELKNSPVSRRAQAITWIPTIDLHNNSPPCLQRIQFLIRGGVLNMNVDFRSRDILSAAGANMFVLTRLQEMVARLLEVKMGWYSDTSVSAHIYYARDEFELKRYFEEDSYKRIMEERN